MVAKKKKAKRQKRTKSISKKSTRKQARSDGIPWPAVFAHVVFFIGPILAWVIKRRKDKFSAQQAVRALAYQVAVCAVFLTMWVLGIMTLLLVVGVFLLIGALLFGVLAWIYSLYAAYQVYRGKDFNYVIIRKIIK